MSQDFPLGIESWVLPLAWCGSAFLICNHMLCLRLLNVLEVIAPFKHFNKLREFVQMKLPPGFPVKLGEETKSTEIYLRWCKCKHQLPVFTADIPVFPTITATVTFQEFRYDEFDQSMFIIPSDYKEDPSRFPDL